MAAAGNPSALLSFSMITIILSLYAISAESRDLEIMDRNRDRNRNVIKRWCVAIPGTEASVLEQNLRTICGQLDCRIIMPGGDCYFPPIIESHASVALNLYYKANGATPTACSFPGSMVTLENPTFGYCRFI